MVYGSENVKNVNEETIDYLAGSKPSNVVPSYATVDEMVYYVVEANERDFNEMMMSIGIEELHHLEETGTEMVYEAEDGKGDGKKSLAERASHVFSEMWRHFQELIQGAISWLDAHASKFRHDVIDKLGGNKVKEKATTIPADKDFGESYTYPAIEDFTDKICSRIKIADKTVDNKVAKASTASDVNGLAESLEKTVSSVKSQLNLPKEPSAIKKAMIEAIQGEKKKYTGSTIRAEFNDMYEEVLKFGKAKRKLKKDYNEAKKIFNQSIHNARLNKTFGKGFNAKAYTLGIKAYKDLRQILVYAEQATISCINKRQRFYMSVILKVIGTKKNKDEKKETSNNESAMIGTYDRVSSLFEW